MSTERNGAGGLDDLPARVAEAFEVALRDNGSPLLLVEDAVDELRTQAVGVVTEVVDHVCAGRPAARPSHTAVTASIGVRRASDHVDPTESVRAAALLFDTALPPLVDGLRPWEADAAAIARRLNRAVLERVAVGSVSFGAFLLGKVHTSHADERRRMARELHDRIAHGVAVALQQVELASVYAETDLDKTRDTMLAAGTALRSTMDDVRRLSRDIRETVADNGGLDHALAAYLDRHAPDLHSELSVTGDSASLPAVVAEELFVVLREAIRNALRHSEGTRLQVSVDVGPAEVTGQVSDDGQGFVPQAREAWPGHGMGMVSMRERIDLLGGVLSVDSDRASGTVVSVAVPLRRTAL